MVLRFGFNPPKEFRIIAHSVKTDADGSFLPTNISTKSFVEIIETIQQSSIHYMDELEKEMSEFLGYQSTSTIEV